MDMKTLLFALCLSVAVLSAGYAIATVPAKPIHGQEEIEHGGGCRKSSPAGQCCHKDHSTGMVHCH
jgi:hypothetical protein